MIWPAICWRELEALLGRYPVFIGYMCKGVFIVFSIKAAWSFWTFRDRSYYGIMKTQLVIWYADGEMVLVQFVDKGDIVLIWYWNEVFEN